MGLMGCSEERQVTHLKSCQHQQQCQKMSGDNLSYHCPRSITLLTRKKKSPSRRKMPFQSFIPKISPLPQPGSRALPFACVEMTASKTSKNDVVRHREERPLLFYLAVILAGSSWHCQKGQLQSDSFQEIRRHRIHCHVLKFPPRVLQDPLALRSGDRPSSGIVL